LSGYKVINENVLKNVAIIGGGILGLAIGYRLIHEKLKFQISIFEKESDIGLHQSGNNSGVMHCGLYYQPGSLKARLAVEGIRSMIFFCEKNQIPHEVCGKIVVATNEREAKVLNELAGRGEKNGLRGLRFLNRGELITREPHVKANKVLLVPEEGIVDYRSVMKIMADDIEEKGHLIKLNQKVVKVCRFNNHKVKVGTNNGEGLFDLVINCSGLHSDINYSLFTNSKRPFRIIPFRGEYMHIKEDYQQIFNHLIYPVPDPAFPFLGVHFTRMTNGNKEVGPNAVLAFKREGYKSSDFSFIDTWDALTYKGFIRFISQNLTFTAGEFASSFSEKAFVAKAKKLIPDVEEYMFKKGGTSGVRAQAMSQEGNLIMDFEIRKESNQIHILNAPSPGATASLAIAGYIIQNYVL
jgi:L-2-hydroxyglutarate oxidase